MRKKSFHPLKLSPDYVPIPDKIEMIIEAPKPKQKKIKERNVTEIVAQARSLNLPDMYFNHPNTYKRNRLLFILGSGDPVKGYHRFHYWKVKVVEDFLEIGDEIKMLRDGFKFSRWANRDCSWFSKSYYKVRREGINGYKHMMFIHNIIKLYARYKREA